jgi:hypothetical protein
MGLTIFWAPVAEISRDAGIVSHLNRSDYQEHMLIKAGADLRVQAHIELNQPAYPVYLGLFDGESTDPLAAIEVLPGEERYVTSWSQSFDIMESRFLGYEVTQLGGVGYKMADDTEETIYYGFEIRKPGEEKVEHYLVKRDTGAIYIGAYDEKMPFYPAVPVKIME